MKKEQWIMMCRAGFENVLSAEVVDRWGAEVVECGMGWIRGTGSCKGARAIFESDRIERAAQVRPDALKPISEDTVERVFLGLESGVPWSIRGYTPEQTRHPAHEARIKGIEKALLRGLRRLDKKRHAYFRENGRKAELEMRLCLTEDGLWYGVMPVTGGAGIRRMKMDPLAPSRSYLKMEEALSVMGCEPEPGQRVIDLGAAPGGWTYAFLKRGCEVLAVDHGPLKLQDEGNGQVTHVKENGLTYEPPADWGQVDWMVADMLIAPGMALGLLRRWVEPGRVRRMVCNMKLPQQHPYVAVEPLLVFCRNTPTWRFDIRQLYHDRREITVMGERLD